MNLFPLQVLISGERCVPYASYTRDRRKQDDSTTYDVREDVDVDIQYLSDIDDFEDEKDGLFVVST